MFIIKDICEAIFWTWFTITAAATPFVLYRAWKESR